MPRPAGEPTGEVLACRHRTLVRGTEFLGGEGRRRPPGRTPEDNLARDLVRTRLLGNHLRELDRFLNVMAEDAALHLAPARHDRAAFARLTNTPNKLRAVRRMMDLDSPDHERLRAVRRISDCLHHCGGRVHDPDRWRQPGFAVTIRLAGAPESEADARKMLVVPRAVLDQICRLYRQIADDLLADALHRGPLPLTSGTPPPR